MSPNKNTETSAGTGKGVPTAAETPAHQPKEAAPSVPPAATATGVPPGQLDPQAATQPKLAARKVSTSSTDSSSRQGPAEQNSDLPCRPPSPPELIIEYGPHEARPIALLEEMRKGRDAAFAQLFPQEAKDEKNAKQGAWFVGTK